MFSCFSPFIQVKHKYTHISYIASIGLTNPLALYDAQKAANFFSFITKEIETIIFSGLDS